MKKFVTISDVAKEAGVSINTVSRVLNNKPDVSPETRKKVLEAAKKLGYIKNATASCFRRSVSKTIGVVFEDSSNPFYTEVFKGIEMRARGYGYQVILMNTERDYVNELKAVDTLLEKRVDGIIISPTQFAQEDIEKLLKLNFPFVILGVHFEGLNVDEVYSDDVKGGYLATKHLLEKGRRKILMLNAYMYKSVARMRYEGYLKAHKEFGIEPFEMVEIEEGYESAFNKIMELSNLDYDAIFCFNDVFAIACLKALKALKRNVPEDVAIVGYDDISYASFVQPSLTTVRIDKHIEGMIAFDLLYEKITEQRSSPKQIVLDVELIVREST
ncbi:LacI family DNA-binding transcriptional regulator [Pseudothermotoga thermarum]|uniref:Transcriptional regulator, LacI family n=1 Tax=Pseudothermotoga thermarum DSM 5069 TaxID=688269 RepID=F7YUI0_9THEM|nr:LacI family DNA-binding transcriptional regulator [Pseudothermotoga thermarum]AEH51451.1 transcriptional regulator, LacI family [Pseudothermotoga thermarum DSM 5069]